YRLHDQPKFRRPARHRRAHASGEPGDGGRLGDHGRNLRSASADTKYRERVMEKFKTLRGAAAPLLIDNINTDQIAPAQFMRALEPDYQTGLFARWRMDPAKPFVLDMPRFKRAPILVTG